MATATSLLTIEQFHDLYLGEGGYEYWFGEVVRKPMPTWLHAILQCQLAELLRRLGYFSGSELTLRVDRNWEPIPDVAGAVHLELPYPTKPINIAIEILSDDQMARLFEKCRNYARIGIGQIFVFDPEARVVWEWSRHTENLERIDTLLFGNGSSVEASEIWLEFESRLPKP